MSTPNIETLKELIGTYYHLETHEPGQLGRWIKSLKSSSGVKMAKDFEAELLLALSNPGFITPEIYERLTEEELPDQNAVQQKLNEIWVECFSESAL